MIEAEDSPAMSFAEIQVRDGTVLGDGKVLELYDATALVGGVGEFPRHIRTALSLDRSLRTIGPNWSCVRHRAACFVAVSLQSWRPKHEPSLYASTLPRMDPQADLPPRPGSGALSRGHSPYCRECLVRTGDVPYLSRDRRVPPSNTRLTASMQGGDLGLPNVLPRGRPGASVTPALV